LTVKNKCFRFVKELGNDLIYKIWNINNMSENEEVNVVELYGYENDKGQKVYTPNLEFAHIMAEKYGTKKSLRRKKLKKVHKVLV